MIARIALLLVSLTLAGCRPDLGACDDAAARTVVYTDDLYGWPAYEGQALVEASCGGRSQECHSSRAEGATRHGAPFGLDFDLTVLNATNSDLGTTALAHGQLQVYRYRYDVLRQVERGDMPPGDTGSTFVTANTYYFGLPSIRSAEGRRILRNWLACGAPVVERTDPIPKGTTTVGAVVGTDPCPDPTTDPCGGTECTDTSSDPSNCGACGASCLADPRTCSSGTCDCPTGWQRDAGGTCKDLASDAANCGAFGNVCAPGASCVAGACGCTAVGATLCTDACVDTTSDVLNCSGCGLACPAGATCSGSTCTCAPGLEACVAGCVDTMSDVMNCGTCEHACNPSEVCFGGSCLVGGCPGTTTDCSGSCVDTSSNSANCGACGNACTLAGSTCIGSACACPAQSPPLTLCSAGCVDTASSSTNCGGCGVRCPTGTTCAGSICVCSAGTSLCTSGCADLQNDSLNCGTCGHVCPSGATCGGGVCTCQTAGLTACGEACVDLTRDASNCASCGHACANGQACSGGSCSSVSFASDIQPIFTNQCALSGCHTGRRPAASMALDAGTAWFSLLGNGSGAPSTECTSPVRLRVAPNSPDTSYLIDKLLGVNMCQGNEMPKIGTYLPNTQIDLLRAWIAAGAPNN